MARQSDVERLAAEITAAIAATRKPTGPMNARQARAYLNGMGRGTWQRHRRNGTGPTPAPFSDGGRPAYTADILDAWLAGKAQQPTGETRDGAA
ncbi:MAG: hypothetical protein WAZ19_08235 [Anaerolineae bacterium]|jgi:hypothetical protein